MQCDFCELRAAFTVAGTEQLMCQPCAFYWAGQEHGRAMAARDQLSDAVGELLIVGVSPGRIEHLTRAFIDSDMPPPVLPKGARPKSPRPWTHALVPVDRKEGDR